MLEIFFKKSNIEGTSIMPDLIPNSICEFNCNPDKEITFSSYYKRYEDVFQ